MTLDQIKPGVILKNEKFQEYYLVIGIDAISTTIGTTRPMAAMYFVTVDNEGRRRYMLVTQHDITIGTVSVIDSAVDQ